MLKHHSSRIITPLPASVEANNNNKRTASRLKFWITLVALLVANTFLLYFVNLVIYNNKENGDVSVLHFFANDELLNNKTSATTIPSNNIRNYGEIPSPDAVGSKLNHQTTATTTTRQATDDALEKETLRKPLNDENPIIATGPRKSASRPGGTPTEEEAKRRNDDGENPAASRQGASEERRTGKQLNVVVFYADDWRHDTIGAAGTQPVKTPFLDELSRHGGIRFTHNCVTTSVCWISRATMFTGQYLSRHKSQYVRNPAFYEAWNETYIYTMQQNGYFVGHLGKWQYRDYDFVKLHYNWTSLYEGSHWHNIRGTKTHSTVHDEREAIRFLRERPKGAPFVFTAAFYAPKAVGQGADQHFPMDKTEHLYDNVTFPLPLDPEGMFQKLPQFLQHDKNEARKRYKQRFDFNVSASMYERHIRNYFRMVSEVDEAIKNIVEELELQGILNDTVIIFTTDNGLFTAEHGLAGKWFPHEESIRIPLIIKDPRMPAEKVGTVVDEFTLNIDLAPTILGAAGLPPHPRMQGRDIADLYLKPGAEATWREEFFYEHPAMGRGIPESSALVRKDYKYMFWPQHKFEQLFDLTNDPLEHNDIAGRPEHAALLAEMRARHDELKKSVV